MRGFSALHQPLCRLSKFSYSATALQQPRGMGRIAFTRKTEEPTGSQPSPTPPKGGVTSGRSRSTRPTIAPDAGVSPSKIVECAASPKRKAFTSRPAQDHQESSGQQAITADAPHTPVGSREKRSGRRSVKLARRDIVTASIPQLVAAVATLPTESGARTLQEAPVPVWTKELMQEAAQKLSAAAPCKLHPPLLFLHPCLSASELSIGAKAECISIGSSCTAGMLDNAHAPPQATELIDLSAACSASTAHTGARCSREAAAHSHRLGLPCSGTCHHGPAAVCGIRAQHCSESQGCLRGQLPMSNARR